MRRKDLARDRDSVSQSRAGYVTYFRADRLTLTLWSGLSKRLLITTDAWSMLANRICSKTLLRGGYGIFYDAPQVQSSVTSNDFTPNTLRPN